MATTISPGSSATIYVDAFSTITLTASASSTGSLSYAGGAMDNLRSDASFGLTSKVYGPFGAPGTVTIAVNSGVVTYDVTYISAPSMAALKASGAIVGPQPQLPKTYAAIKRVVDGMGDMFWALFGDSKVLGGGVGTGTNNVTGVGENRYAGALAAYLRSIGIPAADNNFFGEGLIVAFNGATPYGNYDPRFAIIGTTSYYAAGDHVSLGGVHWQLNASGEGIAYTPQIDGVNSSYDRVKIIYCNRTTGQFTVSQPGGGSTAQTITTTAASNTIGITTVSLTRGTGVCNISWASGDNWIIGAIFYDSQNPRVNVLSCGQYGDTLTSAQGVVNNANEWRGGAVLSALALDLTSVAMTVNSYAGGTAGVTAFSAALNSLCVNDILASGSELILETPSAVGTASQGTISDAYVAAIKALAATLSAPVHDVYAKITPYATYSGTLYKDTLHENLGGTRAKSMQCGRFVRLTAGI